MRYTLLARTASSRAVAVGLLLCLASLGACTPEGATVGTPIDYADWALIEPDHPRLAPDVARALDVAICTDDLPPSSRGYLNAAIALTRVNDLPGVDLSVLIRNIVCGSDAAFFASPPPADLVIKIVSDTCLGNSLSATAAVCYYEPMPIKGLPQWTINDCADLGGCEATSAVLMLRASNFGTGQDPSVGVIAHELGHALGLVHGYWPNEDCPAGSTTDLHRAIEEQHLMSLTVVRGTGRGFVHGNDARSGRVSAYTLGYLQERYPAASVVYAAPEWYAHEMVIMRSTCGGETPVTPASTWEFADYNPASLCWDEPSGRFVTCDTRAAPRYTVQYSSLSEENCTDGAYPRLLVDGVEVARGDTVTPDCGAPLVQYTWVTQPELGRSIIPGGGPLPRQVTLTIEVVSNASVPDDDPSDNAVSMTVSLDR